MSGKTIRVDAEGFSFRTSQPAVCLCFIASLHVKAIVELQSEKYVQTVDEEAVLELDSNDKSLYVFSDFTSDAFEHCRQVCFYIMQFFHGQTQALCLYVTLQIQCQVRFIIYN